MGSGLTDFGSRLPLNGTGRRSPKADGPDRHKERPDAERDLPDRTPVGRRGRNRTPSSAVFRQRSANELHASRIAKIRPFRFATPEPLPAALASPIRELAYNTANLPFQRVLETYRKSTSGYWSRANFYSDVV